MDNHKHEPDLYTLVAGKAMEIEVELKRLKRWQSEPLPAEKFENMGAFGSHTMAFEQWIQFILLPRIQEIIREQGEFPTESMLAPYAVRAFDGDPGAGNLHELLYALDKLINEQTTEAPPLDHASTEIPTEKPFSSAIESIPTVVYTLAELLPQFKGDDLESQLQSFDVFLNMLASSNRIIIAGLLQKSADQTDDPVSKERIEQAALSVAQGGRLLNHTIMKRQ